MGCDLDGFRWATGVGEVGGGGGGGGRQGGGGGRQGCGKWTAGVGEVGGRGGDGVALQLVTMLMKLTIFSKRN